MKKQLIIYGCILALLAILLKWIEYRYLVINYAVEIYGSALAIIFTVVGLWVGRKLTTSKEKIVREEVIVEKPVYITSHSDLPKANPEKLGFSNQEIAEKTFLSIHTIKTHASNLFMKLDVKRRTQAISRAKELKLIS